MNHHDFREASIFGRYVTGQMLEEKWLPKLQGVKVANVGKSVDGNSIHTISVGSGKRKVFMWSQMHGNESTTTKAVLDLITFLTSNDSLASNIREHCELLIVPILNPDGAERYTRVNANEVDLNRDAKQLTQPESKILRKLFEQFQPDFCFNLHGQRTLFSAGNTEKSATISFLSPASDETRKLNPTREQAMRIIVAMNHKLQLLIPGQVGRYDDGFNDNCVGDSFQMQKVPTILFEAGHYPNDYEREKTREYIFYSLVESLKVIANERVNDFSTDDYFSIPENQKLFFDILIKNLHHLNPKVEKELVVGIRYKETLENDKVSFEPEIADMGNLDGFFGHKTYDCADSEDVEHLYAQKNIIDLLLDVRK